MRYQSKSNLIVIVLTLIIITATPVIAQVESVLVRPESRLTHTVIYDIGGEISIRRQIGHACTTGAVKRTNINGFGEMSKIETVRIGGNIINVDESSNWIVPTSAISNLSVTTIIQLCNRPMTVVTRDYNEGSDNYKVGDVINVYHPLVVSGDIKVTGLTDQIWATALVTNPGYSGGYQSDFTAAYGPGPYERVYGAVDPKGERFFYDEDFMWTYDEDVHYALRDYKKRGYDRGDYYVGNYFNINQYAFTDMGEMRRYISLSSPFENLYFTEDMTVLGAAAVRESLKIHGLKRGPEAITLLWYDLF